MRVFLPFQQEFWVRVHTQLPLMKQQQQLQKRVVDTCGGGRWQGPEGLLLELRSLDAHGVRAGQRGAVPAQSRDEQPAPTQQDTGPRGGHSIN